MNSCYIQDMLVHSQDIVHLRCILEYIVYPYYISYVVEIRDSEPLHQPTTLFDGAPPIDNEL